MVMERLLGGFHIFRKTIVRLTKLYKVSLWGGNWQKSTLICEVQFPSVFALGSPARIKLINARSRSEN